MQAVLGLKAGLGHWQAPPLFLCRQLCQASSGRAHSGKIIQQSSSCSTCTCGVYSPLKFGLEDRWPLVHCGDISNDARVLHTA